MLKIGLTGGIGSGKSTAASYFAELGICVIDADKITRELTKPHTNTQKKIIEHFGPAILKANGELDRNKLRQIIFSDAKEKYWLEQLLHPLVYKEISRQIKTIKAPYCILVIPLLLESKHEKFVDRILVIDAPETLQLERSTTRDQADKDAIKQIIAAQLNRQQRLNSADDIIVNDKNMTYLKQQVTDMHKKYLQLS